MNMVKVRFWCGQCGWEGLGGVVWRARARFTVPRELMRGEDGYEGSPSFSASVVELRSRSPAISASGRPFPGWKAPRRLDSRCNPRACKQSLTSLLTLRKQIMFGGEVLSA